MLRVMPAFTNALLMREQTVSFQEIILVFPTANLITKTVPLFFQLKLPSNLIQVQCEEHWIVFLSIEPQVVYLTHYGRVKNVEKNLGPELLQCLDQLVEMALELKRKIRHRSNNCQQ